MNLETVLGCDHPHAEAIENTFRTCVGKEIKSVEIIPSGLKGKLVKVSTVDGEIYFLKISKTCFLWEIRMDSPTGEIVYQVLY